jgi:hypothetical protein
LLNVLPQFVFSDLYEAAHVLGILVDYRVTQLKNIHRVNPSGLWHGQPESFPELVSFSKSSWPSVSWHRRVNASAQRFDVGPSVKAVIIHWMTPLGNLARGSPGTQRVRRDAQNAGRLHDGEV